MVLWGKRTGWIVPQKRYNLGLFIECISGMFIGMFLLFALNQTFSEFKKEHTQGVCGYDNP